MRFDRIAWVRHGSRAATALGLGLALGGCSFAFMRSAPSTPTGAPTQRHGPFEPVTCTSSRAAPIVDTVGAVAFAGLTGISAAVDGTPLHAGDDEEGGSHLETTAFTIAGVITSVAYVASAIYGYGAASQCSDAKAAASVDAALEHE